MAKNKAEAIKKKLSEKKYHEEALKHKNYLIESIRVISRGILDEQCPKIEGCIRLKVLIDNYSTQLHQQDDLQVIELIYAKTSHIPTLEKWKSLSKGEKLNFQNEMDSIENAFAEKITKAARFLKDYPFEARHH